jgi:DUF1680 family protein
LTVNGKPAPLNAENGYARITRTWRPGDTVTLEMDMPVRRVVAHPAVKADRDRFALERGPLVYCAEGVDNGGSALTLAIPAGADFRAEWRPDLLNGIMLLKTAASRAGGHPLVLVPYHVWAHRGPGEMSVWLGRTLPRHP